MVIIRLEKQKIKGVFPIEPEIFGDNRGFFVKFFNSETFRKLNLSTDFKESYYTVSKKNVIRGMHFQVPPHDHDKLVYVPHGEIIDVVLDIRKNSDTFGDFLEVMLSGDNGVVLYVPKGCAHGFKSLKNDTIVTYMQTTTYKKEHDMGILFNSFGYDWNCEKPILSERDKKFIKFDEFESPF